VQKGDLLLIKYLVEDVKIRIPEAQHEKLLDIARSENFEVYRSILDYLTKNKSRLVKNSSLSLMVDLETADVKVDDQPTGSQAVGSQMEVTTSTPSGTATSSTISREYKGNEKSEMVTVQLDVDPSEAAPLYQLGLKLEKEGSVSLAKIQFRLAAQLGHAEALAKLQTSSTSVAERYSNTPSPRANSVPGAVKREEEAAQQRISGAEIPAAMNTTTPILRNQ